MNILKKIFEGGGAWSENLLEAREKYKNLGKEFFNAAAMGRKYRKLPEGLWPALAKQGLFSSSIPNSQSGGIAFAAAALEGLIFGLGDGGTGISLVSHLGLCLPLIHCYAHPKIKDSYLTIFTDGSALPALAITEPQGGSEPHALRTTLKSDGAGFRLNGEKWSITNAPVAAAIIVTALETNTNRPVMVLVDATCEGVDRSHVLNPTGLRSSPTGSIIFKDVRIPETHILGKVGEGFKILYEAFIRERILAPFVHIGGMDRVMDETFAYTMKRVVFKKPISEFQYIRKRITDMKVLLETTRLLAHQALRKFIFEGNASMEASMAKFYSANASADFATHAIKVFGSHRFEAGDLDEFLMSSLAASMAGGTEEIHREVIFQNLYRQYRRAWDEARDFFPKGFENKDV